MMNLQNDIVSLGKFYRVGNDIASLFCSLLWKFLMSTPNDIKNSIKATLQEWDIRIRDMKYNSVSSGNSKGYWLNDHTWKQNGIKYSKNRLC